MKVKLLGYECKNLTEADKQTGLDIPLSEIIERFDKLAAAWQRGQLLRNIEESASALTVSQAAKWIGFQTGQQLRDLLDTDLEVRNLWDQNKIYAIVKSKKALLESAEDGNQAAIKAIEVFLRDEGEGQVVKINYERLGVIQLADIFGVSRQTIHDWYNKQGLPRNGDGTFDLKTTINWFEEFTLKKAARSKDILGDEDPLRMMKAEKLALEMERVRGQLLDRNIVISGQVSRFQNLINSLDRLTREVVIMLANQPVERMKEILANWRDDVIIQQRKVPEELQLSTEATDKFKELLKILEVTKSD